MRYAVCNELFGELPLGEACAIVRERGYEGVEFAPYTVFGDFSPAAMAGGIRRVRASLAEEGLSFVGFHWLLAKPEGLHIAAADPSLRARSREHIGRLLDASGELGGGLLVLGSPRQRSSLPGQSREETEAYLRESLSALAPLAAERGSSILIEQLSPEQTDVVTTMAEAAALVDSIDSASISSMFDFHNAAGESEAWVELLARYSPYIRHVHVNEVDGRAPGSGSSDFGPAFRLLAAAGYPGWLSMELFEIPADPSATLASALAFMRALEAAQSRDSEEP